MRGILTGLALALALAALPAWAAEYTVHADGREVQFALPLPENWVLLDTLPSEIFFTYRGKKGADDDLAANAHSLSAGTPLADRQVIRAIDLGKGPTVTRDKMVQQAGFPARRIDGTAISEGDKLFFSSIAIKPAANAAIIQLDIWGSPDIWRRPEIQRQVEDMLGSLKPLP